MSKLISHLNEYTWYSRLAAMIFFVGVMPALAFHIGTQFQLTLDAINSETPEYGVAQQAIDSEAAAEASAAAGRPRAITAADNGQVVHVASGDEVALMLDPGDDWTVKVSDANVLSKAKTAPADSQGLYLAKAPGSVDITATGRPHCEKGEMCSQLVVLFKTYVVVQ